jgi:hypothetical protein
MLGSGMTTEQIIDDHKELEKDDILASLNFAKLYLRGHSIKDVARRSSCVMFVFSLILFQTQYPLNSIFKLSNYQIVEFTNTISPSAPLTSHR